jgi:hypothetical protein
MCGLAKSHIVLVSAGRGRAIATPSEESRARATTVQAPKESGEPSDARFRRAGVIW